LLYVATKSHHFVPLFQIISICFASASERTSERHRFVVYQAPTAHKTGRTKKIAGGRIAQDHFLECIIMSHYLRGNSAAALRQRRQISWRMFFQSADDVVRSWIKRRQQRQEFLDYMALDHRAAADIGLAANDARDWAERPFWQP
jgi:uncharacterized protein YjiS (DUF1127 family)